MGSSSVLFYVSMEIAPGQFRSGESGLVTVGERSLRDETQQKGKAHSDIRQKEVISGRFPITKSELARCCLRDEGPI